MKQNNAKLVNSYVVSIFNAVQCNRNKLKRILCELNIVENIVQKQNFNNFNLKSFFKIVSESTMLDITKNILILLSQKSRLSLISLLVDILKNKIEFTFALPIAVIYAPSIEIANKIKEEKFPNQIIVFKVSSKIVVILNNKTLDFSSQARILGFKSQVLKNLSNI